MSDIAKADAANRSVRTLIQGLAVDALIAVAGVLLVWLPDADLTSREAWTVVAITAAKSVLTAVASYVMRIREG
ncbi:hypothetical protein [Aeromicrobium sp. HA]|uniref:hypothetical protein n=1 Tax=Aeromicrobium sp. HA TaxID=3009077 RepID=UPI0022AFBDC0|nr:hypothetical protein [Aeromicrobium sp. HA]